MAVNAGPTVVRRQLGRIMKRMRSAAGVSADTVVANLELGISRAKLYRIEAGQHMVRPQDIVVLCHFYGADPEEMKRLTSLAVATQGHGDSAIPEWFQLYRDLEQVASRIRYYEGEVVPGQLQTADYARAVFRAGPHALTDDALERLVTLRLERQEKLFSLNPGPRFATVINEAALSRPVGGDAIMRAQLARLRDLDADKTAEIRVLPFSAGAHSAVAGAFRIVDFDDPDDPNIVYLEAQNDGRYLQKPDEYREYDRIWSKISRKAIPLKEFSP
ncbi:MAG: helix-turn-helix domain-containing protein [Micromonosporaceae bacterium]